jgi:putative flippase GtrA
MLTKIIKNKSLVQFIKFGLVGITGTVIDFGIYNLLLIKFNASPYIATICGFSLGLINNYTLNKIWTFRSKSPNAKHAIRELIKFALVALVGMGINISVMALIINYTNLGSSILGLNIAKIVIVVCVGLWNYLGAKKWVFSGKVNNS